MSIADQLPRGIEQLGLEIHPTQQQKLLDYLGLLQKWNRTFNLTAVRDPADMVTHHLLDSLALVKHFQSQGLSVIDVGTGAGIPGIPLSIVFPDNEFTLLDSNGKKTRFLTQAKIELGLANCTVVNSRVEGFQPQQGFDVVTSRAFTSLESFATLTQSLVAADGCFYAMKGVYPQTELDALPSGFRVERVDRLEVPSLEEERHLVVFTKGE